MKWRYSLIIFIALIVTLNGCILPDLDSTSTSPHSQNIIITFAAQEADRDTYEPIMRSFSEQNPDIRVQFVPVDHVLRSDGGRPLDTDDRVRQWMSLADTSVSLFWGSEVIDTGYLHDLKPFIDTDPSFRPDDFYSGALDVSRQGNGIYFVPQTLSLPLLSYNKDLWATRGIPAPQPQWTWNDLIEAARRLAVKRNNVVETYGLVDWDSLSMALLSELAIAGVDIAAPSLEQIQLDQPDVIHAIERVADMVNMGAILAPSKEATTDDIQPLISNQQAGMWPATSFFSAAPFAIGTVPFPEQLIASGAGMTPSGYVMSSGTQHSQEAWRWLSFLSRQMIIQPAFRDIASDIPARKSLAQASGYWDKLDEQTTAAITTVLSRPMRPHPRHAFVIRQLLSPALHMAINNNRQGLAEGVHKAQLTLQRLRALQPTPRPARDALVVATPVPVFAPDGAVAITFRTSLANIGAIQRLADAFNAENPDIFVTVEGSTQADGSIGASGTTGADCFFWPTPPDLADVDALLDLQPFIDSDPDFSFDDYPVWFRERFKQGTATYGIPYTAQLQVLGYNADAFRAVGLARPLASWTLDDLQQTAQRLTTGSGARKQYGFVSTSPRDVFFFLDRFGASPEQKTDNGIRATFTDPKVIDAVRFYITFLRNYSPNQHLEGYTSAPFSEDIHQLFHQGRIGLWLSTTFSGIHAGEQRDSLIAVAPPPFGPSKLTTNDVRVSGLFIAKQTQYPNACWAWIKYISAQPAASDVFSTRSSLFTEQLKRETTPGATDVSQTYQDRLAQSSYAAVLYGSFEQSPIDYFWFLKAVDRALQGEDLEQALAEAQQITERYLACRQNVSASENCTTQVDPAYNGLKGHDS